MVLEKLKTIFSVASEFPLSTKYNEAGNQRPVSKLWSKTSCHVSLSVLCRKTSNSNGSLRYFAKLLQSSWFLWVARWLWDLVTGYKLFRLLVMDLSLSEN